MTHAHDKRTELIETEAPAGAGGNTPIVGPGLGNISVEMADFRLERSRHDAAERAKRPKPAEAEVWKEVNEAWQDFVAEKIKRFRAQSQFGPGGNFQRDGN